MEESKSTWFALSAAIRPQRVQEVSGHFGMRGSMSAHLGMRRPALLALRRRIPPPVYQKSDSAILVMKTTENRSRCDDSEALNRARERGIFAQRAMNS